VTSPGPTLFKGPRSGKNGQEFDILKFRTMHETEESYQGPHVTASGDKRITKYGLFLRNSKLNELPQLYNIAKGEMSFVGPRPEHPSFVEAWTQSERDTILSVRPGLTSLATLRYRNEESLLNESNLVSQYDIIARDKRALDMAYVRRKSLIVDLDIVLLTLMVLLRINNSNTIGKALDGPLNTLKAQLTWLGTDLALSVASYFILNRSFDFGRTEMQGYLLLAILVVFCTALVGGAPWFKNARWSRATALQFVSHGILGASLFGVALLTYNNISGANNYPLDLAVPAFYLFSWSTCRVFVRIGYDVYRQLYRNTAPTQVLIIGAGIIGESISWILQDPRVTDRLKPVGFLDDDEKKWGLRMNGLLVVGSGSDLSRIISERQIDVILFATDRLSHEYEQQLANEAQEKGVLVWHWKSLISSMVKLRDSGSIRSE